MTKFARALALALAAAPAALLPAAPALAEERAAIREVEVVVDGTYRPSRIEAHEGERLRLKFVRKDYSSCTREVVFPTLNIRRALPTNKPVLIELPALSPGEFEFRCGMNMVRGVIVVHPRSHAQR